MLATRKVTSNFSMRLLDKPSSILSVGGVGWRVIPTGVDRMSTIAELKQALRALSAAELESIADWLEWEVEEPR